MVTEEAVETPEAEPEPSQPSDPPEPPKRKQKLKVIEAPVEKEVPREAPKEEPEEPNAPKRMGRHVGAKDSKPRQRKEEGRSADWQPRAEQDTQPFDERMERDPAHDCYESKRLAVERAYHAQAVRWMNLASRLMQKWDGIYQQNSRIAMRLSNALENLQSSTSTDGARWQFARL